MSKDYEIGYGKPPKRTRYKTGQSGNPKGRPKGSRNMTTIAREILDQPVVIKQNGKQRRVPYQQALLHSLAARALEGSVREKLAMWKAIQEILPAAPEPNSTALTIKFVESDGNGRPAKLDRPAWHRYWKKQDGTVDAHADNGSDEDDIDDPIEAAWKASGIDDAPNEPS